MARALESIGSVVCPRPSGEGAGLRGAVAIAAALAIHAVVGVGMGSAPIREGAPAAPRERQPMRVFEIDAVAPPPPPAPAPTEPPPPAAAPPARALSRTAPARTPPASSPAPETVAPAQTARALAAAPKVLDFTDFDIVTGAGDAFVGGVSASDGANTVAARGTSVERGGVVGASEGSGVSLARGVRLPAGDWSCPWPDDARALHDREREVRVRAVVREDGSVASVELLSDPGHGFGEAALRCARAARFAPALDAAGRPVEARSPPIRVRFVR